MNSDLSIDPRSLLPSFRRGTASFRSKRFNDSGAVIKGPWFAGLYIYILGGGILLASYIGIIISHYKDPYEQTFIMECHKGFDLCSSVFFVMPFMTELLLILKNLQISMVNWSLASWWFTIVKFHLPANQQHPPLQKKAFPLAACNSDSSVGSLLSSCSEGTLRNTPKHGFVWHVVRWLAKDRFLKGKRQCPALQR